MVADIEELEMWTRQKSVLEGSVQKKRESRKRVKLFSSQTQTEQRNCLKEIMESENPLQGGNNVVMSEDLGREIQGK